MNQEFGRRFVSTSLSFLSSFLMILGLGCPELRAADPESPSYRISQGFISGGGGSSASSSSYKVEEGSIPHTSKEILSSTSYKLEPQIGSSHGVTNPPLIESISPGNLARFFTDGTASYTVTAKDTEGGSLQYQLKVDQALKLPWQTSNTLSYALATADKGRHALTFEVKDSDGVTATNHDHYIFRRPLK